MMAKTTNTKAVFLDVDASIVEKNLRFTDSSEEEITKIFGAQEFPSKLVKPIPGFCVKTKEASTGCKVFVNVCQTDAIPPPKDISTQQLRDCLNSEDPGDYRVPMSIGEIRTEPDKKGQDSKTCDIAIHPDFFKKIENHDEFKSFFFAIVFQGIEDKYGIVCEDEKTVLKNRKAFGTLQTHRIQQREISKKMAENRQPSLIGEIEGTENKKVVIETISSTENEPREPEYRLYKKSGQNCLYGEFRLPDVLSSKELTLDIGEDRLLLESKTRGYLIDIFVPYIVKQKGCSSSFNNSRKVLTVTMPLVGG